MLDPIAWVVIAASSVNVLVTLLAGVLRPRPIRLLSQPRTITVNRYVIRNQMPAAPVRQPQPVPFTVVARSGVLPDEKDLSWKGAGHIDHNQRNG